MHQHNIVGCLEVTNDNAKGSASAVLMRSRDGRVFVLTSATNCVQMDANKVNVLWPIEMKLWLGKTPGIQEGSDKCGF